MHRLPADNHARELIEEVDIFRSQCKPELRHQAQHLIEKIRFSEITLASAEIALANLEDKNTKDPASDDNKCMIGIVQGHEVQGANLQVIEVT